MGRYDDITPDQLRTKLSRFARLVLKLEERGTLLDESPGLLKLLGELRQMIFAYEVRGTKHLLPPAGEEIQEAEGSKETPGSESLRIVREALERERELQDELRDRLFPDDDA